MSEPGRRSPRWKLFLLWLLELGLQVFFILFFYVILSVLRCQLLGR